MNVVMVDPGHPHQAQGGAHAAARELSNALEGLGVKVQLESAIGPAATLTSQEATALRWGIAPRRIRRSALVHTHWPAAAPAGIAQITTWHFPFTAQWASKSAWNQWSRAAPRSFQRWRWNQVEKRSHNVYVSEYVRDALGRVGTVIENGMDPRHFRSARASRRGGQPVLGFLGRWCEEKQPYRMLKFADEGALVRFVGTNQPESGLRSQGSGAVEFLGTVSDEEKWVFLDSLDALVLPSDFEAQPIVLLEAMARQVPVVCTRLDWLPEHLRPNATRLEDFDLRDLKQMSVSATPRTWIDIAREYVGLYESAMER